MSMTRVLGEFLTAPGSVMCNELLSHFYVMFALEISWYIVYQSYCTKIMIMYQGICSRS